MKQIWFAGLRLLWKGYTAYYSKACTDSYANILLLTTAPTLVGTGLFANIPPHIVIPWCSYIQLQAQNLNPWHSRMSPANRPKLLRCRWCCTELRLLQANNAGMTQHICISRIWKLQKSRSHPKSASSLEGKELLQTSAPRRNSKAWRPEQKQKTWRTKFSSILESRSGLTCKAVSKLPQPKPSTNRCSKRFPVWGKAWGC